MSRTEYDPTELDCFDLRRARLVASVGLITIAGACQSKEAARTERPPRVEAGDAIRTRDTSTLFANHFSRDHHYPPNKVVSIPRWLEEHRVKTTFREKRCWDAKNRAGVPPAPGLVCEAYTANPPQLTSRVYRLESRQLRAVWEGVVGSWKNSLELTPLLASDGAELVVHDATPEGCERAMQEYARKAASGSEMNFGKVLAIGCAGRGVHAWSENRYVQLKPPRDAAP
jgi:hypothetical protein